MDEFSSNLNILPQYNGLVSSVFLLKAKSGVGIMVGKMKDYSVVKGAQYFSSNFSLFFSAKLSVAVCKMSGKTSLFMTSLRLRFERG